MKALLVTMVCLGSLAAAISATPNHFRGYLLEGGQSQAQAAAAQQTEACAGSPDLTRREAVRLLQRVSEISRLENRMRADGLTPEEMNRLSALRSEIGAECRPFVTELVGDPSEPIGTDFSRTRTEG
jgi:hypothetical protein